MSVTGSFPYVPCPTLDQQYSQKSVGPTPYSSAKTMNADYEAPTMALIRGPPTNPADIVGCKMSYPSTLRSAKGRPSTASIVNSRAMDNIFKVAGREASIPSPVSLLHVPNSTWQAPPPTFALPPDPLHPLPTLPRDTLHPLISSLQAGENEKAAALNPVVAYLANAARTGPPCEAHKQATTSDSHQGDNGTTSGVGGGDDDDDNESLAVSNTRKTKQVSLRGDLRTHAGRNFSALGGFHEPELYATTIIETASSQPTSLTAMAAKALASALHDKPSHALVSNVTASVRQRITPNSGPKGTNVNRYERAGLNDRSNPVVPPPQAFRNLSSDVQEVLLRRERDCRFRVAKLLKEKYCVMQPAPFVAEGGAASVQEPPVEFVEKLAKTIEKKKKQDQSQGVHPPHNSIPAEKDPEELDTYSDSEMDPVAALGDGSTLGVWVTAVKRCSSRRSAPEDNIPIPAHPAHATVLSRKLKVLTPQLITMHSNMSFSIQPTTYLNEVGVAMGDTLAQMKPPSASSFLHAGQVAVTQYSDLSRTPANAFGFDSERFITLLSDKGEEVEELFLEGCSWLSARALAAIGRYCVNLKLLNLQDCPQLTDEVLTSIVKTCRKLCYVNISGCLLISGQPISEMLRCCTELYALCMNRLPLLDSDADLAFSNLDCTPKLTILDVSYCENLTNVAIANVARFCRGIEILDISGCMSLTDIAIASIGSSCTNLRQLRLKLCSQFTASGFARLCVAPRNLSHLDLGGITSITPPVFEEVVKAATRLKRLMINGCILLDDVAVNCITRYCKKLEFLNISSCTGISMASCMELVHELIKMRWLIVSESSISNAEVVMLSALRESCKIIRNQYRPQPKPTLIAYAAEEKKKKKGGGGAAGDKKKKK